MYPVSFQKPENALKRAEELINVNQKSAALNALHEVITSKRHRTWQKTLEKIMFKYVELCVDMKRGRFAKEGLIQYRIVCQGVNVNSLEEVIKHFLKLASEKAEAAQAESEALVECEDLEASNTPENLMLSYVSGEKGKDRTDRQLVTPWFKFLWETYRTVLEILRNNSKLEALYAMTAYRAFQFCKEYKRVTEFRRLCEILRNHLANLNKYRDQRDRPDLTIPESLQLYLETRFEQLKVATELELWQEAFRSVEDIHGLMTLVKKSPKPQMMAIYYAKLTKIFWKSENYLYHAYAWYKLYHLSKTYSKTFTPADLKLMMSCVVLSTLAVPPYDRKHGAAHFELELEKDRNLRMANLLGFSLDPKRDTREVLSRAALMSELNSKNMVAGATVEVRELFQLLEHGFNPLDLCQKVAPLMEKLATSMETFSTSQASLPDVTLADYVPALERLTILRTLQQVSHVYNSMKMPHLKRMIPFQSFDDVEKLVVDAVKFGHLQIKIDHQNQCVHFGCQTLESDRVRNHITTLAKRLNKTQQLIASDLNLTTERKTPMRPTLEILKDVQSEHERVLARCKIIEKRKELQEQKVLEQEREEETRKAHQQKTNEDAEKKRQAEEARKREEDRIRRDIEEKEDEEARALLEQVQKRKGKKGKIDENTKLDKRQLMEDALTEQIKERQETERKLQRLSKQMDHLERARREEEVPLLKELYQKKLVDDKAWAEKQEETKKVDHLKQWEQDVQEKERMSKMTDEKKKFMEQVMSRRAEEFARRDEERLERLEEHREYRKSERLKERKKEFLRRLKVEEEERIRKVEEDKRRAEQEEMDKKEAEARAIRDRQDEKDRQERDAQMEAESEERAARAAEQTARPAAERPSAAPAAGGGGGGDRWQPRARDDDASRGGGDRWGGGGDRGGGGGGGGDRWERRERPSGDAPPPRGGGDRWGGGGDRGGGREEEGGGGGDRRGDDRGGARRDDRDRAPPPPRREEKARW